MVARDRFVADRAAAWDELEDLVRRAGRRPSRLEPPEVLRLGNAYRAAAADLAIVRRRFPGDPLVARLEALVARGRHAVYADALRRDSALHWLTTGFWRRVHERPGLLLVAALLLLVPMALAAYWGWREPGDAAGLVPAGFRSVTDPRPAGQDLGIPVDEQAAFASQILTNNIRVSLLAFGGGLLLGVGAAAVLIYNGLLIGAITGLAINAGNGRPFFELVTAHGVLELSCIVVAGAAGLRLGDAILHPGTRRRGDALRAEARAAVEIVLGVAALLVVAGLIEGFVTPAGLGLGAVLVIGLALGGAMWALVLWRGRPPRAPTSVPAP